MDLSDGEDGNQSKANRSDPARWLFAMANPTSHDYPIPSCLNFHFMLFLIQLGFFIKLWTFK
ncbi:hypothetical protein GCM10010151_61900 [Actinoallomurus spadix]|uniref:Uncharacterized protein n=1 Tax=Actinoallomurus spadix TaxID=79912 RepID=A0ABN0XGD3_9ACTN